MERAWSPVRAAATLPVMPIHAEHAALMREVPALLTFPPEATGFFNVNYLGGPVSKADGYAFPALADLRGLCPTLVLNAEYDDLRASGQWRASTPLDAPSSREMLWAAVRSA